MTECSQNEESLELEDIDFSIAENISRGVYTYDKTLFYSSQSLKYEGKTLSEWNEELEFPFIDDDDDLAVRFQEISICYIKLNEVIHSNLGIAKAAYHMAELYYRNRMTKKKAEIRRNIEAKNQTKGTSRMPGIDTLEAMAEADCLSEYASLKISEIIFEFWQTMSFRLKNIDSRLTSLSILRSAEIKAGN